MQLWISAGSYWVDSGPFQCMLSSGPGSFAPAAGMGRCDGHCGVLSRTVSYCYSLCVRRNGLKNQSKGRWLYDRNAVNGRAGTVFQYFGRAPGQFFPVTVLPWGAENSSMWIPSVPFQSDACFASGRRASSAAAGIPFLPGSVGKDNAIRDGQLLSVSGCSGGRDSPWNFSRGVAGPSCTGVQHPIPDKEKYLAKRHKSGYNRRKSIDEVKL